MLGASANLVALVLSSNLMLLEALLNERLGDRSRTIRPGFTQPPAGRQLPPD
jgi:hypothetical protein